ncbi:MAG: ubiquitin-like small modifier protein 1 [Haloarculaceae archaeon]
MDVTFVAYGPVREIVGEKKHERTVPDGATVGEVLDELVEENPDLEEHLYGEDGGLSVVVSVTVDGTNLDRLDGLATELDGGEKLRVRPPIHGG